MTTVFEKPRSLTDAVLHYCPGCTHGIAHRLIMEVLEERGDLGNCCLLYTSDAADEL